VKGWRCAIAGKKLAGSLSFDRPFFERLAIAVKVSIVYGAGNLP